MVQERKAEHKARKAEELAQKVNKKSLSVDNDEDTDDMISK